MNEYLQNKKYVYRKSYKYYQKIDILIVTSEFLCSASGLSAFVFVPLAVLSLSGGVIEVLRKNLKLNEKKQEMKLGMKFYYNLFLEYKAGKITEDEVYIKEKEFITNLEYTPREKYLKQKKLNGY